MLSFVVALVVVCCIVAFIRHRGSSKTALSGTVATKPVFQIDPPRRRMSPLKDERL